MKEDERRRMKVGCVGLSVLRVGNGLSVCYREEEDAVSIDGIKRLEKR